MLSVTDHTREKAGLRYIYPVLSRRSGGLSIGINLNTNNACNWRCIYCQVPGLSRGGAPMVNFELMGKELRQFLGDVIHGSFYERESVPHELRCIRDIAISGNGEPTTSNDFHEVTKLIALVLAEFGLLGQTRQVLISNGSRVGQPNVRKGLRKLAENQGEVWFKVDSVTPTGIVNINQGRGNNTATLKRLATCAALCPTWIQSCFFMYKKKLPPDYEINMYLDFLKAVKTRAIPLQGVMLYGIARPSMQPGADELERLPEAWFEALAEQIQNIGINITFNP